MEHRHLNYVDGQVRPSGFSQASPLALKRRLEHQRQVIGMGLTPDTLSDIVDVFYTQVRRDAILGPVFQERIGDNWAQHLDKMKSFWVSVALNAGGYSGKPVKVHVGLSAVTRHHFAIWLALFRSSVYEVTQSEEAVAFLMARAEKMAANFQKAMALS